MLYGIFLEKPQEKSTDIAEKLFVAIPKLIHYCWLSNDPVPAEYRRYMDSWKIKIPDYQFILWDTKRFDINKTTWTRQSFEAGVYACACDYIRLFAVYNHGGIYLDMDMEVVQPFDPLLTHDLMLSYENHISENLEAGCFGAVKGHQYIKKCMEYFENNNFFDPSERDKIMDMPICERHDYIDPLILPEIMKKAFEHFKDKGYRIYSREYFTAKNIVTGKIEQTQNTFTIHHFTTQYHSPEWRKGREIKQKIHRIFGEKTLISKILHKILSVTDRIKQYGITKGLEYYIDKYIRRKSINKKTVHNEPVRRRTTVPPVHFLYYL